MIPLDELVLLLTRQIHDLTAKVIDKETKLADLFKHTSKVISAYETKTQQMLQVLHATRDEQVFIRDKKVFIRDEQVVIQDEQVFIRDEQVFIRTEQVFLRDEQVFIKNEQVFIQDKQVFIRGEQVFVGIK